MVATYRARRPTRGAALAGSPQDEDLGIVDPPRDELLIPNVEGIPIAVATSRI